MEYQKTINVLDETTNQASNFRTRNCVEINDESKGMYDMSQNYKKGAKVKYKKEPLYAHLIHLAEKYPAHVAKKILFF